MKPIDQTKLHDPPVMGNCLNAALASILEIKIEDIPCFEDMDEDHWFPALSKWLEDLGFYLICFEYPFHFPGYAIDNGISPRGTFHSVIFKDDKMVHDPHPSRGGLLEIRSVWVLVPFDPAACKKNQYLGDSYVKLFKTS